METNINMETVNKLLRGLQVSLDKRNINSFFYPFDFLEKLLQWHYEVSEREEKYLRQERDVDLWAQYNETSRVIDAILIHLTKTVLTKPQVHIAFSFFQDLEKHYNAHPNNTKYWTGFFSAFCPEFFNNIKDSIESYDIWNHYFPSEWKITQNNLQKGQDSPASRIWLTEYIRWAIPRIENPEEEYDSRLEEITRNLFTDIDPVLWSHFLIFALTAPTQESKMRSIIERKWNFGYVGHIFMSDNSATVEQDFRKQQESYEQSTLEFIVFFNTHVVRTYAPEDLPQLKIELETLKDVYESDSREERNRLRILYLVNKLIEYHSRNNINEQS